MKRPQGRPTGSRRPQAPVQPLKAKPAKREPKAKSPRLKAASIPQLAVLKPKRSLGRIVLTSSGVSVTLLLIFVLVAAFTPLLAVEKIQFKGNERIPTKLLASALSGQIGKPLPQVSLADVSKDLENFTLIQSVSVVNLPPHTLQVRIVERQPICIITTALGSFLYDPAGVRIASAKSSDEYPVVQAAGKLGASPEFRVAIKALLALPVSIYPRVATVSAPSMDSVTFKLRGWAGQKVIWGDTSQAELKARVLLALVKHQKKSDRVTYDVSSPKAPTVRY